MRKVHSMVFTHNKTGIFTSVSTLRNNMQPVVDTFSPFPLPHLVNPDVYQVELSFTVFLFIISLCYIISIASSTNLSKYLLQFLSTVASSHLIILSAVLDALTLPIFLLLDFLEPYLFPSLLTYQISQNTLK